MKQTIQSFTAIFQKEPEGGYTVTVPSLPGCVTYGETIEEAQTMAQDAILGYIESLKKHGDPIPTESQPLISTVNVKITLPLSYAKTAGTHTT